jgi:hypothetical protein
MRWSVEGVHGAILAELRWRRAFSGEWRVLKPAEFSAAQVYAAAE